MPVVVSLSLRLEPKMFNENVKRDLVQVNAERVNRD